jgi:hypothetical protein
VKVLLVHTKKRDHRKRNEAFLHLRQPFAKQSERPPFPPQKLLHKKPRPSEHNLPRKKSRRRLRNILSPRRALNRRRMRRHLPKRD